MKTLANQEIEYLRIFYFFTYVLTYSRPETPSSEVSAGTASCAVTMPGEAAEYSAKVIPTSALKILEDALTTPSPRDAYYLKVKQDSWFTRMPSLRVSH